MGLERADAIVVLGAAVWKGGRPSPTLERRVRHATELYRQGFASLIVLSGGLGRHAPTEAQAMAAICGSEGIPVEALLLENRSTSTFENVQFSAEELWLRNANSVIVVTDDYHLRRALMCFRYLGFVAQSSASPAAAAPGSGLRHFKARLREAMALPFYRAMLSVRLQRPADSKAGTTTR